MKPRRDVRHAPHSKRRKWKRRNDRSLINRSAAKPALPFFPGVPSFPLADDVLKVLGEQLDAGEEERQIFGEVAQQLWNGNFVWHSPADQMSQLFASKAHLERVLRTAHHIRKRYQTMLYDRGDIPDFDFQRSLTAIETRKLRIAWMNDVDSLMSPGCLLQYNNLIQTLFMTFMRHPSTISIDGIRNIFSDLLQLKNGKECEEIVRISTQDTAEVANRKRKIHLARLDVKHRKRDHEQDSTTDNLHHFASGELIESWQAWKPSSMSWQC